ERGRALAAAVTRNPRTARRRSLLGYAGAEAKIEIARIERVLVFPQRRVVRRYRNRKPGGQLAVQQPGALELVEAREVGNRVEPEMAEKRVRRPERNRPARRLAPAARL